MGTQPTSSTGAARLGRRVTRVTDFGVDLYGPVDLVTGLGTSARGFARALTEAGVPVHIAPTGDLCTGLTTIDPGLVSDPRRFPLTIEHINADTTERFLWHFGDELKEASARVAMWYWELAAFRPEWIGNADHYDEVWVASRFGQRSVAAMTNVPVAVCPPPVPQPPAAGDVDVRGRLGVPADAFLFLYVFDYSSYVDRKNPACLVDAFVAEFAGEPEVRLVLKLSHPDRSAAGYRALVEAAERHPNLHLVDEMLELAELHALFETADCYVSPHRSEGFGLTLAEAMLRGTPVIATDYGSTTDFLTPDTGYPIEYRLVELAEDQGPYPRGYVWADPSREHLRQLMRDVAGDPDRAREVGEAGRRLISEEYSLAAAGARMRGRLLGLHEAARA
jgi:glycosyltransferase involved in cell wall biosynthesis